MKPARGVLRICDEAKMTSIQTAAAIMFFSTKGGLPKATIARILDMTIQDVVRAVDLVEKTYRRNDNLSGREPAEVY